jgi:hypothetical protein
MPPKNKQITPADEGFFHNIANQIKLIIRLIRDPRVYPLLKLLPIFSLGDLIIPDIFPLNPLDDAVVIGLGTYLFVELCPPDVVQEHKDALKQVIPGTWKDISSQNGVSKEAINLDDADIEEGEFREK